ncbi:MAG TPA: methylamine utilization protein [Thermoanaerobaculia bacterium]|nr:methylamine utilization protein [Thermoanaerobaculia bacterium]
MLRFLLPLVFSLPLAAATLTVQVTDARGRALDDAVVYAVPEGRSLPLARRTATMDQRNRQFVPQVLPVQAGTAVHFPNNDDVQHHVYSFSPAKKFQLPLYKGTPANPEIFDRAGVVTLGCNIHDQMSAFIIVVDTPYFAKTERGLAAIDDVEAGRYTVEVWNRGMRFEPRVVTLKGGDTLSLTFAAGRGNARP